ncbi:MAG: hypothetical protein RR202_08010 [Bacteroidales bacterium]
MSEANKPLVNKSFEMIKQYLKSAVPPCVATVDTPEHYEVTAVNNGTKHLFGYCIAHRNTVTMGFNEDIPESDFKQLVPKRILEMMNENRRIAIRDADEHELSSAIRDACNQLLYYYNEKGWYAV